MSELINQAIVFATNAHDGQYRKFSAIPYIMHPMEVAAIIASMTPDEHIIAAGLLHDVVEDTDVKIENNIIINLFILIFSFPAEAEISLIFVLKYDLLTILIIHKIIGILY